MHYSELAKRRRRMGLSQAELAAALGVHWNTLARWERGELTVGRPVWVKTMLDLIEREREARLSTTEGHDERNGRMDAVMRHDLKRAHTNKVKRRTRPEKPR
jgi:transcriptional regulator with XRE-family HTH domain